MGSHPWPVDTNMDACCEAVRQIGTNGFPILLGFIQAQDCRTKQYLLSALRNPPLSWLRVYPLTDEQKHWMGCTGFSILGTNALPATQALIALGSQSDRNLRLQALLALWYMYRPHPVKEALLPALRHFLADPDVEIQRHAADMVLRNYPEEAEEMGVYKLFPQLRTTP